MEIAGLVAQWRSERTSELAERIDFIDLALRPGLPLAPRLDRAGGVDAWCATLAEASLGPWLDELCARAWEASDADAWAGIARCTHALAALPADPRIGRAIERMLRSSSDHWFRVDQVAHAIDRFEAPNAEPSFADHALPLLTRNADRGTGARLARLAERTSEEADCNGAEMAGRLDDLAVRMLARSTNDRPLDDRELARLRALPSAAPIDHDPRRVLGRIEPLVDLDRTRCNGDRWSVTLRSRAWLVGPHLRDTHVAPEWERVARLHANDGIIGANAMRALVHVEIFEDLSAIDAITLASTEHEVQALACWLDGPFESARDTLAALAVAKLPRLRRVRLVPGASWRPAHQPPAWWDRFWSSSFARQLAQFETYSDAPDAWRSAALPPSIRRIVLDPIARATFGGGIAIDRD